MNYELVDLKRMRGRLLLQLLSLLLMVLLSKGKDPQCSAEGICDGKLHDPYQVLGVAKDANQAQVIKAYRSLARRWHPDKHKGSLEAEKEFSRIAHAYGILKNDTKREILDRLGQRGLERLQDGDPTVMKDYVPPDEVLRKIHNDPPEAWFEWLITSTFAALGRIPSMLFKYGTKLRVLLGVESETASVYISATDSSGASLYNQSTTTGDVIFKFSLSGRSTDFVDYDVKHNCLNSKFLGMKTTYYLECFHTKGLRVSVGVDANTFTVAGKSNAAASIFILNMT